MLDGILPSLISPTSNEELFNIVSSENVTNPKIHESTIKVFEEYYGITDKEGKNCIELFLKTINDNYIVAITERRICVLSINDTMVYFI